LYFLSEAFVFGEVFSRAAEVFDEIEAEGLLKQAQEAMASLG
jgi:hypothetical protein